jgi:4-hydroxy-tetrahydrodipicolinate synthase
MFKGILTPVITILDEQGRLDFAGNQVIINRLIANGINGLLFFGSIGEFFAFTMEEKKEFIKFAVKTVNKRVPVLIGTGGTVQEEVIDLTRFAEKEGADGVVVVSPYYFKLDAETIYRYYANLARSTSLPIMLYNFPDRTASDLSPDLVLRLAKEFSHIVAIKDTVDNISHTRKLIQFVKAERPDFTVLSGFDEYLIPNLMAGGDGVLCGLTNIVPELFADLLTAYHARNFEKIAMAQSKISILMNLYDVTSPFIAGIKGAVALRGVPISAAVKEPAAAITEQQLNVIRNILAKADQLQ